MLDIIAPPSCGTKEPSCATTKDGLKSYYVTKIEELQLVVTDKTQNLRRLQAQRNELNAKGKQLTAMTATSLLNINCFSMTLMY